MADVPDLRTAADVAALQEALAGGHPVVTPAPGDILESLRVALADAEVLRAALAAEATEPPPDGIARRATVAESIYQRHAAGWRAVLHEIIEPPCWNRRDPDDTEPMTPDQVAWLKGEPLEVPDGR